MYIIRGTKMEQKFEIEKVQKKSVMQKRTITTITYVLLSLWALMVLFPFYWMILTSVKSYSSYNSE